MTNIRKTQFAKNVQRGRKFEAEERAEWQHMPENRMKFEAPTQWHSKLGRIDIEISEADGSVSIIEMKATDWFFKTT